MVAASHDARACGLFLALMSDFDRGREHLVDAFADPVTYMRARGVTACPVACRVAALLWAQLNPLPNAVAIERALLVPLPCRREAAQALLGL